MRTNPQRPTLTATPPPRGGSTSDKSLPSDLGQATRAQSLRGSLAKHMFAHSTWEGTHGWSL